MPDTYGTLISSEAESSTASTDVAAGSSAPDSTGVKGPDSISAALDAVQLEEPADAGDPGTATEAESKAEEAPTHAEPNDEQAEADGAADKQDERSTAEAKADGSLNVPFAKRPEWEGLMKLVPEAARKDAIKTIRPVFEQAQRFEAQVKELTPKAALVDEFRSHAGDEAGFQTMRQIIRAYATDPAASVPILEQMLTDARQRGGLVVTSPDLTARLTEIDQQVADGVLDETVAAKWKADLGDVEKARVNGKTAQARLTQQEQAQQKARATAAQQARVEALNQWEENIRSRDPSFGNVTDVNDPEHGKSVADQVLMAIRLKASDHPQATTEDLIAEANRVHRLAKSRLTGPPRQQRVMTAAGSSVTATRKPMSVRDAMDQVKLE